MSVRILLSVLFVFVCSPYNDWPWSGKKMEVEQTQKNIL